LSQTVRITLANIDSCQKQPNHHNQETEHRKHNTAQQNKVTLANSTKHTQKKPTVWQEDTGAAWFSCLLWHLAKKWILPILSTPEPTRFLLQAFI